MRLPGTLGAALLFVATAVAQEPLELQTQFGKTVPILGDGEPRIIVYADQEGSDQTAAWSEALHSIPCPAVAVAKLSAVPDFARTMARESFEDEEPIALDWEGALAERLGFEKNRANVYLVGSDGRPQVHRTGEPTPAHLRELKALAREACDTD